MNLTLKKLWFKFEHQKQFAILCKTRYNEAEKAYTAAEQEYEPLIKKKKKLDDDLKKFDDKKAKNLEVLKKEDAKRKNLTLKLEEWDTEYETFKDEKIKLVQRQEDRKKQLLKLNTDIEKLKDDLKKLPSLDVLREARKEKVAQMDKLKKDLQDIHARRLELKEEESAKLSIERECLSRIKEIEDIKLQRREALRRWEKSDKTTEIAEIWRNEIQSELKGTIYGPVAMELNVPNATNAKYLEQACQGWYFRAFVCENDSDRALMISEIRDKRGLKNISVVYTPEFSSPRYPVDLKSLAKYGIDSYLYDCFEAPNSVKQMLLNNVGLDLITVGSSKTTKLIKKLFDETPITDVFTPEDRYKKTFSKYGSKNSSLLVTEVKKPKILSGVNMAQKENLQKELAEARAKTAEVVNQMKLVDPKEEKIEKDIKFIKEAIAANDSEQKKKTYYN